ncbi:MAG: hypothetical protein HOE90_15790 [Bacteriovoracaceae bacterium]|nr:hypothetical protein [Bacteriovoracaceae bacterium]
MKPLPYFCTNCRSSVPVLEDMFLVEEKVSNLFCSEDCIVEFYQPIIKIFEDREKELRLTHEANDESSIKVFASAQFTTEVFEKPDEIWRNTNELTETIFTSISRLRIEEEDHFLVVNCLVYRGKPSFILHQTLTQNTEILNFFREGEKVLTFTMSDDQEVEEIEEESFSDDVVKIDLDSNEMANLEQKKSEFLAVLLEKRSDADISYEKFQLYDECINETIDFPDEIFFYKDSGDEIFTYIKAFEKNETSFFYFVICTKASLKTEDGEDLLIPILTFPSIDGEIYKLYKRGEQLTGTLKN